MLVGVAIYAKVFATPGEFANLRLDSLSTLFYVSNWHFIVSGGNYFAMTAQPSPLEHMWSLSIEEQFYIVWPPVALLMLHLGRKLRPERRLWPIFATAVIGAIASAVDMRLLYSGACLGDAGIRGHRHPRQDILVGAALAIGMAMWAQHRPAERPIPARALVPGRSGRAHPATGTAGAIPPRPHRRDLHRRRGPSLRLIEAWEITSPPVRLLLQVLGWSALVGGIFLWTQLTVPTSVHVRGRLLPLRPRGGRGHLLCRHRPDRVPLPGARATRCSATWARSPTAPTCGISPSSPSWMRPASISTGTRS